MIDDNLTMASGHSRASSSHSGVSLAAGCVDLVQEAILLSLPCFACNGLKKPLTARGFYDATTDRAAIVRMFADPAARLIAIPTGHITGLVVVDVDVKDDVPGM